LPHMRPRCCLRYFTFFGINIKSALSSQPSALSGTTRTRLLAVVRVFWLARFRLCRPSTSPR
jgi:hypothetical protein